MDEVHRAMREEEEEIEERGETEYVEQIPEHTQNTTGSAETYQKEGAMNKTNITIRLTDEARQIRL